MLKNGGLSYPLLVHSNLCLRAAGCDSDHALCVRDDTVSRQESEQLNSATSNLTPDFSYIHLKSDHSALTTLRRQLNQEW